MTGETGAGVWKKLFGDYSDAFLDHAYEPRNVGSLDDADVQVKVTGSCGDTMQIWLRAREERIEAIRFLADGCQATLACGSAVTVLCQGRTIQEGLQSTPQ